MGDGAATDEGGAGKRVLLADFARMYGADLRTVKRWRAKGREAKDEILFEDPEKVLGWWQRNMKLRVPPGILEAVRKWRVAGKSTGGPVMDEQAELPVAPAVDLDAVRKASVDRPVEEEEKGLSQMIGRLQEMEVRFSRVATDPGQSKAWLDTIARFTSAVEKLRVEEEKQGKLIPKAKAETMIHEFHQPVEREVRLMLRAMAVVLGLPVTPVMEEAWNKECDRLFARFQEEVFR